MANGARRPTAVNNGQLNRATTDPWSRLVIDSDRPPPSIASPRGPSTDRPHREPAAGTDPAPILPLLSTPTPTSPAPDTDTTADHPAAQARTPETPGLAGAGTAPAASQAGPAPVTDGGADELFAELASPATRAARAPQKATPSRPTRRAGKSRPIRARSSASDKEPGSRAGDDEPPRRAQAPLDPSAYPYFITTASLKGGVGKTTVAACLGLALAEYRRERVVVVDANFDGGTLSDRLVNGEVRADVQHLLDVLDDDTTIGSVAALERYLHSAQRLSVLAGHKDPRVGAAFAGDDYATLLNCLGRFFHMVLADAGTGLADAAMRAVLDHTRTLLLVTTPALDATELAAATLALLADSGYAELVENTIAVVCHPPAPDFTSVRAKFAGPREVIDIPTDPHLAEGGLVDFAQLAPNTKDAYLRLAGAIIDAAQPPDHS